MPVHATLALAEKMPEVSDGFGVDEVNSKVFGTFAELVKHIAVANYQMVPLCCGKKLPSKPGLHGNGPDSLRSKADVVRFRRNDSLDRTRVSVNEHNLLEVVERPEGGRVPLFFRCDRGHLASLGHLWTNDRIPADGMDASEK